MAIHIMPIETMDKLNALTMLLTMYGVNDRLYMGGQVPFYEDLTIIIEDNLSFSFYYGLLSPHEDTIEMPMSKLTYLLAVANNLRYDDN